MIPEILPPTVVRKIKSLKKKLFNCIRVMKYMDIGLLKPATLSLLIAEVVILDMLVEMDLDHNRPSTFTLAIIEK